MSKVELMRSQHTSRVSQTQDGIEFGYPGYRIITDFDGRLPRPGGDWRPMSLFSVDDEHHFLLLKYSDVGSFWQLDATFKLVDNDHGRMQAVLERMLRPEWAGRCDRGLVLEVRGLMSSCDRNDQATFDALLDAHRLGGLRDAESYLALVDAALRLGRLSDVLPLVEAVLDKPGFFTPEQAAKPKTWLGQAYAERLAFAQGHKLLVAALAGLDSPPDWLHGLLDQCVLQDATCDFGQPPAPLMEEIAAFEQAALDFLAGRPTAWRPGRYPTMTVARYWVHRAVRTIHLEPDNAETVAQLRGGGLSPVFLQAVARGRDGVGDACLAASPDIPFAANPAFSHRVKDIAAAVLLGGKPVLCPFTGERALARDTINLHTFLHRKDGRSCIIFSDPDISIAPADSAWYFPDLGVLLTHGWNMRPETDLAVTMQRVLDNLPAVNAYLSSSERTIMVSEESMGHVGHYIWNVISGWNQLFQIVRPEDIGVLTSLDGGHFFGGVTELYAEEIRPVGRVMRLPRREDAFAAMLEHRGLSLILRDRFVAQDLARRVQAWCERHVSAEFLVASAAFRRAANPLLMITIRLENRAWVEQESGCVHIINCLAAEHPGLGIVIDGLNALPPGTRTFVPMSLADEQAMAGRIVAACPGVRVVNTIGCPPAESVVWCSLIDAFMAPVGAGLAKSRWIANKPGVGFSNRTFLEDGHFEGYLYSHFRENPTSMRYVAREHVQDADEGHHGLRGRANFSMDWRAPLAEIRALLAAVKQGAVEPAM